jgi:amino acid transporter
MSRRADTGATRATGATGATGAPSAETAETDEPRSRTTTRGRAVDDSEARDRFGGTNWGAAFFGWLVAIALTILLTSIVGAIVAAVSANTNVTQTQAQRQAGSIGIAAAIVLLVVLAIGYYAGGYVAGRMSRYDGGRQGLAVWVIGLIVTILALALGALFGSKYNILDRVNLPRIPLATDQLSWGGVITAVVVLVVSLLAAMLGGAVGHRYHNKVDRAAFG